MRDGVGEVVVDREEGGFGRVVFGYVMVRAILSLYSTKFLYKFFFRILALSKKVENC